MCGGGGGGGTAAVVAHRRGAHGPRGGARLLVRRARGGGGVGRYCFATSARRHRDHLDMAAQVAELATRPPSAAAPTHHARAKKPKCVVCGNLGVELGRSAERSRGPGRPRMTQTPRSSSRPRCPAPQSATTSTARPPSSVAASTGSSGGSAARRVRLQARPRGRRSGRPDVGRSLVVTTWKPSRTRIGLLSSDASTWSRRCGGRGPAGRARRPAPGRCRARAMP